MKTPRYNASAVFDAVKALHKLDTDAKLGQLIDVRTDAISSMRAGRVPFGPTVQNKITASSKLSARRMKTLMLEGLD